MDSSTLSGNGFWEQCGNFPFIIIVTRVGGGSFGGSIRIAPVSGKITNFAASTVNLTGSTDSVTKNISVNPGMAHKTAFGGTYPQGSGGSSSGVVKVELWSGTNGSGTKTDEITYDLSFSSSVNNVTPATPLVQPTSSYTGGIGYLYFGGILPEGGREGLLPDYDATVQGEIVNGDTVDHRWGVWGDADGDGIMEELIGFDILAGATATINGGFNVPEGVALEVVGSGQLSGDISIVRGENTGLEASFPAQGRERVDMIILPDVEGFVRVGNSSGAQDFLTAAPETGAPITHPREYGGAFEVTAQSGAPLVAVPIPGLAGRPQQIVVGNTGLTIDGSASTPMGAATILSNGQTSYTVVPPAAGSPSTPSVGSGGAMSSAGTTAGVAAATTSALVDQAAAQLAQIRSEAAAAAAAAPSTATGESQGVADGEGIEETVEGIGDDLEAIRDFAGMNGSVPGFAGLSPGDLGTFSGGSVTAWQVPMAGESYSLAFDHPLIPWFRLILFVGISILWFSWILQFSRV